MPRLGALLSGLREYFVSGFSGVAGCLLVCLARRGPVHVQQGGGVGAVEGGALRSPLPGECDSGAVPPSAGAPCADGAAEAHGHALCPVRKTLHPTAVFPHRLRRQLPGQYLVAREKK